MRRVLIALLALVTLAVGVAAAYLWQQRVPPVLQLQRASVVTGNSQPLQDFQLRDQDNQAFTRERFMGRWSLLFFGYTHCPDVCPLTLAEAKGFYRSLQGTPYQADTQVVFVSVDPKRDTPEVLKRYVGYFDPAFIGVSGTRTQLDLLTRPLGIYYAYQGDGDDYVVDHSAVMVLIGPQATLRAVFSAPHTAKVLTSDYLAIRRAAS
jgi:protein SCO1/2